MTNQPTSERLQSMSHDELLKAANEVSLLALDSIGDERQSKITRAIITSNLTTTDLEDYFAGENA
jgi:hypothetical protein